VLLVGGSETRAAVRVRCVDAGLLDWLHDSMA